jgi:flagellar hook-length control protein FliK
MNATPMHLNPGNPLQAPSAAGKAPDANATDLPFDRVLADELAQYRGGVDAGGAADSADGSVAAPEATDATPVAELAVDSTAAVAVALEAVLGLPQATDAPPPATDALLPAAAVAALPTPPGQLPPPPAPATAADRGTDAALAPADGPARRANVLPAPAAEANAPAQGRPDAARPSAAAAWRAPDAAVAAAAATPERQPAAREPDVAKTSQALADIAGNPAMRPVPNAPIDALPRPDATASARLTPAVGTTAWGQALGERMVWMATGGQQSASLTLNPPNLGPLQIVVDVTSDQASASFFSAQPEVRQALEAALPRLREMMNDAGIQLGQATVSADTPRQHDGSDRPARPIPSAFPGGSGDAAPDAHAAAHPPTARAGRGLIDTFA